MRIVCEGHELRTSAPAIEVEGEVDAVDFVVAVDVGSAKRAESAWFTAVSNAVAIAVNEDGQRNLIRIEDAIRVAVAVGERVCCE